MYSPGETIGSYRVVRKIGEGGMGAVYLAEHTLLGRPAAIKVLLRELSHREDLVTRFFNEARAASSVKHPGIVEIYDFGYHADGSAYIVMEYFDGESLSMRLQLGLVPEARAIALCRQIGGALAAAHAKGIVHRDLKPDNIFIVRDPDIADGERAKVLDFGIAKLAGDQGQPSMTRTGMVMGTPAYMAPEQCKGAGNVDQRSDLYAMGCILFEMVCGRPPFVAEGAGEVMAHHIFSPPPLPSSLAPVSPALEQVIMRALVKDPAQRFSSAEDMLAALQALVPSGAYPRASTGDATMMAPPLGAGPPLHRTPPAMPYAGPGSEPHAGSQPPRTGSQPPHMGAQPPQLGSQSRTGSQPPHAGSQPPQFGSQPPHAGSQPPYLGAQAHAGSQPPRTGSQPPHIGAQSHVGSQPPHTGSQPPHIGAQSHVGSQPPHMGAQQPTQMASQPSHMGPQQPTQIASYVTPPGSNPAGYAVTLPSAVRTTMSAAAGAATELAARGRRTWLLPAGTAIVIIGAVAAFAAMRGGADQDPAAIGSAAANETASSTPSTATTASTTTPASASAASGAAASPAAGAAGSSTTGAAVPSGTAGSQDSIAEGAAAAAASGTTAGSAGSAASDTATSGTTAGSAAAAAATVGIAASGNAGGAAASGNAGGSAASGNPASTAASGSTASTAASGNAARTASSPSTATSGSTTASKTAASGAPGRSGTTGGRAVSETPRAPGSASKPTSSTPSARAPATATLTVASTPAGAEVYRMPQGVRIGTTPLKYPLEAMAGEVVLLMKKKGYRDETFAMPADHDSAQTVTLKKLAVPAQSPAGKDDFFTKTPAPPSTQTLDPFAKPKN